MPGYVRNGNLYHKKTGEISFSLLNMVFLGLMTVLSQTLKAANANPVDNLRTE
jgi:hypothetical protein